MRKTQLVLVALAVAAMCTVASAQTSYMNTTGGTVYQLNAPTSWAVIGGANTVLSGAGPDGGDAWYRPGAQGSDDSTQAYWNFSFAPLPDVGQDLNLGLYSAQAFVSDYAGLSHEGDGVFGSWNGPWGYNGNGWGNFSSWNGVPQATPGWTDFGAWMIDGKVWLSNTGNAQDMTLAVKWNPWGGYGGLAVSGLRVSTDGNFTPVPEPASALLLLLGAPLLRRRR